MMNNYTKLAMPITIVFFTMMTALVTMQTTHAIATFVQVNTKLSTNQTGNQTVNQSANQSSQPSTPEGPVLHP